MATGSKRRRIQSIKANATSNPQTKTTTVSKINQTEPAQIWDPDGTRVIKKSEKLNIYTGPQREANSRYTKTPEAVSASQSEKSNIYTGPQGKGKQLDIARLLDEIKQLKTRVSELEKRSKL